MIYFVSETEKKTNIKVQFMRFYVKSYELFDCLF